MATNEFNELLETIGEISTYVSSLGPELADKKTISDIMLALEKILPELKDRCSPKVARLGETLALLYEKFLMEMVEDGGSGLDVTLQGLSVLRSTLTGEKNPLVLNDEADLLVMELVNQYEIQAPAPAGGSQLPPPTKAEETPEVSESSETAEEQPKEEDDFFSGVKLDYTIKAYEPEEPEADQDLKESNPLIYKLSQLAGDATMMSPDFTDKKSAADLLIGFEGLSADLKSAGVTKEVYRLAAALGAIFEKSLMDVINDGDTALELVSEGIKLLEAWLEKIEEPDKVRKRAEELIESIKTKLDVTIPEPAATAPGGNGDDMEKGWGDEGIETTDQDDMLPPPPPPAPKHAPPSNHGELYHYIGVDKIRVATEEDLLLYTEFVSETTDTMASIESDLLELEEHPGSESLINNLFRAFHSLKGAAGFLGLNTVNVLCHEVETLLDKLRKKTVECTQDMADAFLKSVDVIKMVNDILSGNSQKAKAAMPDAELEIPRYNIDELVSLLASLGEKRETPAPELEETQAETPKTASQKEKEEEEAEVEKLGDMLLKNRMISQEQLEIALKSQKPLGEILVEMGAVDRQTISDLLRSQDEKRKKVQTSVLKVDTEKLDSLLDLVGELVISQSIVAQDSALDLDENRNLLKNLTNLGKITKNIQDHVMGLRMVPLKQTFQKMSRLVRDLSKKMKKHVQFHMSGEETEIDKTIIEELNDPLVHLLRNAMDHGVESPEARAEAGKDPTGNVWLSAYHRGGNVYIEIKDDGKGLDRDRIKQKALEKGLIDPAAELSDSDVYNLVFMPGFSTAAKITDVSGRGVGMDVVRSNIDRLGGRVEIVSKVGSGSTIIIKLPLTMAIVDGMIVKIGDQRFIIPTISIRESIRPKKEEVSTVKREGEMMNIRGRLLPLVRLDRLLRVINATCENPWDGLVIIVESDDREYGLMVDDLLGQQQVVIKSLGKRFKGLPGISGGTILGDGNVGLILDVTGVVGMN